MSLLNQFLDVVLRFMALSRFTMLSIAQRLPKLTGDMALEIETQRMAAWIEWSTPRFVPESIQKHMRIRALVLVGWIVMVLTAVACGAPAEMPTPGPKTIQTEGLVPTATPAPTWTPYPTYTPYPTPIPTPDVEAIVKERVDSAVAAIIAQTPTPTLEPTLTPTPEPTPTRAPTPTPEPLVRPVAPPASNVLANILSISSISMQGRVLSISGTIEGQGYDPSTIQVWHAYDPEPYSETCSTERPVAFVHPGNGSVVYAGQLTSYAWTFCTQHQKGKPQVDQVPWIYSQSWEYKLKDRRRITDPYIYDFSMSVNLEHERVERLEYSSGVASGWRVIIFSGERILASQWIGD